jgi:hypothetical protein
MAMASAIIACFNAFAAGMCVSACMFVSDRHAWTWFWICATGAVLNIGFVIGMLTGVAR